jgi:hypothetical protein
MQLCGDPSIWNGEPTRGVGTPDRGSMLKPATSAESSCPTNRSLPEWLIARLTAKVGLARHFPRAGIGRNDWKLDTQSGKGTPGRRGRLERQGDWKAVADFYGPGNQRVQAPRKDL